MEDIYKQALAVVLKHEGGYVNHASDPGGATNFGISLRFLKATGIEFGDVDGDGDVDADDIKALTPEKAGEIYLHKFWMPNRYEMFPAPVAIKTFDLAVNMAPRRAHRCLQRAVRAITGIHLLDDGILGPKSRHAIRLASDSPAKAEALIASLKSEAAGYYRSLADSKPALKAFLKGWLNRAYA